MLSSSVIDNLKCTFCRNSLSIFPIHTYGDKDTVTCGRCPVKNDFLPQREILYEEVAQHLEFACQNQSRGCIERLRPTELEEHEKQCLHKPCFCPVLPVCQLQWQGENHELFEHCRECHPTFAHETFCSEINLLQNYEENHVLGHENEVFVVQIRCNAMENIFYSNVKYYGPPSSANKYLYRTYFAGNKKKKFGCLVQAVQSFETNNPIITETVTSTNFNDIVTNLSQPAFVTCRMDILMKKSTVENITDPILREDNEMLKIVECPVCMDYMKPPIIQCIRGHSFCETCRKQLLECPTCKSSINGTRNYLLESITLMLEYPCKYNKYGCTFAANLQNKDNHEDKCPKKPSVCSLTECSWQGGNVLEHIRNSHKDNIIEDNLVTYIIDDLDDKQFYYLLVRDNIFSIEFEREQNHFFWYFRLQGGGDIKTYKIELDFGRHDENRLYVLRKAGSAEEEVILTLDVDQLEVFMDDDLLQYKIRIIETY